MFAKKISNNSVPDPVPFYSGPFQDLKNRNVLVAGGAGSGKTLDYIVPSILDMAGSYVVTDPGNQVFPRIAKTLVDSGYVIRVLNLLDHAHSHQYNPFRYLTDDESVRSLVRCLMVNTEGKKPDAKPDAGAEIFWRKAETVLLEALVFYLRDHEPDERKRNFTEVTQLIRLANVGREGRSSWLDAKFDAVRAENPDDPCVKAYDVYKMASGKTAKGILASCGMRLAAFGLPSVARLTAADTLELEKLGERKTVLFVITSRTDSTYNFLAAMLNSQVLDVLRGKHGRRKTAGCLSPVYCLFDEFANIGKIPDFEKRLACLKLDGVFCSIILQGVYQLEPMYPEDVGTVLASFDSWIFLGGQEPSTLRFFSQRLGKTEIRIPPDKPFGDWKIKTVWKFPPEVLSQLQYDQCVMINQGGGVGIEKKYDWESHPLIQTTGYKDKTRELDIRQIL